MGKDHYLLGILSILYSTLIFSNYQSCDGYFFGPEFQICDATRLRKYRRNFCSSKLVFTSNATKINSDCICVSGISGTCITTYAKFYSNQHKLTPSFRWMIINRNCVPSTLVSQKGCILAPQIKAMQYLGALGRDDFFAVVTQSEIDLTFNLLRPVQAAVVSGQVWLFNGVLSKSEHGNYCAEKWQYRDNNETMNSNEISRYTIHGKLTVQYECLEYYNKIMPANLEYEIQTAETSECTIDCTKRSASKLKMKREMKTRASKHPHAHIFLKRKNKENPSKSATTQKIYTNETTQKGYPNETTLGADQTAVSASQKSLIHHLHRRFLTKMLAYGFNKEQYGMDSKPDYIPQLSFKILDKLKDIVVKTCAGKVPPMFLEFAYVMFRVAYENRGTSITEFLKARDESDIMQFLNECHDSIKPLKFNKGDTFCPDEVIKTVQMGEEYITVNLTIDNTTEFYLKDRHLTMEIPWNMIDLTLASCIGAFAESYILYHKMEQALEKLFIKDLKILWQYPPGNGILYTRIYGPNWKHYAGNLERCVQSVYIQNPKLTRLKRPGETGLQLTPQKLGVGNSHLRHLLAYAPIKIPGITATGKSFAGAQDIPKVTNSILDTVDLICQPMEVTQCYFDLE